MQAIAALGTMVRRQREVKGCTFPDLAVHPNPAALRLDEALRDVKTKAKPLSPLASGAGSEVAVKKMLQGGWRNARSSIGNRGHYFRLLPRQAQRHLRM